MSNTENTTAGATTPRMSHGELKAALYTHIRDKGVLRTLKGQLRSELLRSAPELIPKLAVANQKQQQQQQHQAAALQLHNNADTACTAVCDSLIENYLRTRQLAASRTVFVGESGVSVPAAAASSRTADDDLSALLRLIPRNATGTSNNLVIAAEASNSAASPVLVELVRRHLHSFDSSSPLFHNHYVTTDVGVQCHFPTPTEQAHLESIEYKLSRVDQAFIRSTQLEEHKKAQSAELRLSKMRDDIRSECMMEARQELERWKEQEGAVIRREERLRAASTLQEKVREFTELERKLKERAADDLSNAEQLRRKVDRQLLQLEEERNDLKKSIFLQQQAQGAVDREMQQLRDQLNEARSRCVTLEAQVEHMTRAADMAKVAELRRLDMKEREIAELLGQIHEQQDRMSQLRFESRVLADECAHTLDEAARSAIQQRQLSARDKFVAAQQQQLQPMMATASSSRQLQQVASRPQHVDPHSTTAVTTSGSSLRRRSSASSTHSHSVHRSDSRRRHSTQHHDDENDDVAAPAAPVRVEISQPKPQPQPQPVQQQHKSTSDDDEFETSSTDGTSDNDEDNKKKQVQQAAAAAAAGAKQKQQQEEAAAAEAKRKLEQQKTQAADEEAKRKQKQQQQQQAEQEEVEAEKQRQKKQQQQEQEQAAEKERQRKQQEEQEQQEQQQRAKLEAELKQRQQQIEKQIKLLSDESEPMTRGGIVREEDSERKSLSTAMANDRAEIEATRAKARHRVAACDEEFNKTHAELKEEEDKDYRSLMWQFNHELTLLKARSSKAGDDDEAVLVAPVVLKRDSDDSDFTDSDRDDVNIFGKRDDEEDDW